ncbi:hypothetical protein [Agrococcus jenensis]|uniref:hypothetical protein n=1 Tax=Agrococcus jenensis TaxID=46353 RepID=UPI001FE56768|nr:hypothetical protein [Agrococcus jenensis]
MRFAQRHAALMRLMFASAGGERPERGPSAQSSAERFFALGSELLGKQDPEALGPLPFLLAATTEGISAMACAGRLPPHRVDEVVDAAVRMLMPLALQQLGEALDPVTERGA